MSTELLDAIAIIQQSGGRGRPRLQVASNVLRDLEEEDVRAVAAAPHLPPALPTLTRIRESHRELARVLARGASNVEASVETGYSTQTISNLQKDPAFQELLVYFAQQHDQELLDAQKRLAMLGVDALEEIHERLKANPDAFNVQSLLDIMKSTLDRSVAPSKSAAGARPGAPGGGGAVSVNISFMDPTPQAHIETIELLAEEKE